jgi:hypothetical protein
MVGGDVAFVLALARIDEEIKAAIGILHFGEEIGFPFRFLEHVAFAVAALRQSEIIELRDAGEDVGGEDQMMDERSAVDRVFAVVAGIMMAAAHIDRAVVDEGIEASGDVLELGSGVARVVFAVGAFFGERFVYRFEFVRHARDFGGSGMARAMGKPGEGQGVIRSATLMIKAEGVGAGEGAGHAVIDEKRKRGAEAGDEQAIFTWSYKSGEVHFKNALVTGEGEPLVRARGEDAGEHGVVGMGIEELERDG